MQHGLYLKTISLENITIKNLYIKWDEKLNISIHNIFIKKIANNKSSKLSPVEQINKKIDYFSQFLLLTNSIAIENCQYKDTKLSLDYIQGSQGELKVHTHSTDMNAHFSITKQNNLLLHIDTLQNRSMHLKSHGDILFNTHAEKIYTKIDLLINNDANLTLFALSDKNRTNYLVHSHKDINNIKKIISLIHLPKGVEYWARDAIDTKSVTLSSAKGFIDYNDIQDAYKNITIAATLNRLNYSYNPKLAPIATAKTDILFSQGVLYIRPKQASSYGMALDRSWLKIDFTKKEELLTLHLLFNGQLNRDMLHILSTYKIKLPFLQHSGSVKTDLTINVNLRTIHVDAKGDFFTQKANFDYLGLNLDVKNTEVKLDNTMVTIPSMVASYKQFLTANVKVKYDAHSSSGIVTLNIQKAAFNDISYIKNSQHPLIVTYNINPKGDRVTLGKSHWFYKRKVITVQKTTLPFNLHSLKLTLPTTPFKVETIADGSIQGKINLHKKSASFALDLKHFNYDGIHATQPHTLFQINYDQNISITSKKNIHFTINGSPYTLDKLALLIEGSHIYLKHTMLYISKFITTKIYAHYDLEKKKAHVSLTNFTLKDPTTHKTLYKRSKIMLSIHTQKDKINIISKELDANFMLNDKEWLLNLNSLDRIEQDSKILQKYHITNGNISLYKLNNEKTTKFHAQIDYKFRLLTNENKPIKRYKIHGFISKEPSVYITVNDKIHMKIKGKKIDINATKIGINAEAITNFIEMLNKEQNSTKEQPVTLVFQAKNSYLHVANNRDIIADSINLQYIDNTTTAQLAYGPGVADFKLKGTTFYLYGHNFNDKFMSRLFSLSKFKNGTLDFSVKGNFNDYEGLFYIKKTTMKDYILLNNILAFVNTIPSLITFSLPGYNSKGLYVKNAYIKFHSIKHILHISDIYLNSKEIKIIGKGKASVKYNNIDLILNLKTDLASNISKVPLVGYLIFDGKSLSTSLKVTGKLTDPKIKTRIAKDIAVAPLNIILRTITLPYKLIKDATSTNQNKN